MSTTPPEPAEDDADLPAVPAYIVEWAWDCPSCSETNSTGEWDPSYSTQTCEACGARVRVTT